MNSQLTLVALAAILSITYAQSCVAMDSSKCDCSWANAGSCGTDDGSECNCMCCCPFTGSCNYNGGGGGGSGGSCSMPPGIPSNPASVNNRDFVACHGKLSLGGSSGLQLVDENGEAVQLMGMSSHGLHWFPDCYTKESITFLVENWGINLFRAAMYIGENGYASNPSHKDIVKDIVRWCKELGIYVMIDWHILSPGNPNAATYSGADDFWREMATLYKDEKHVLYEVANEPNGVNWSEVKQYHDRIIDIIRVVDSETIIICGTPTWSQEIDQAAGNPVAKPYNVMYTFHFYAGSHTSLLGRVEQYASQIPIFVTEWGTSQANGDGGPYLTEAMQFLDLFASAGSAKVSLSFAQWSYADKNEVSAALTSGACGSKSWDSTSCSGTFLKNYIKSKVTTCSTSSPIPLVSSSPITSSSAPQSQAPPQGSRAPSQAPPQDSRAPSQAPQRDSRAPSQAPPQDSRAPQQPSDSPIRSSSPNSITSSPPMSSTPPGASVSPSTVTPTTICREWSDCTTTVNCCPSGTQCFKKDDYYSQCLKECTDSTWECTVVGTSPPVPAPGYGMCSEVIDRWGGCTAAPYCCDEAAGLKCFEKNTYYAQCMTTCDSTSQSNSGWSCRDLGLVKDSSELARAGSTAPRCTCAEWQTADTYCTVGSSCSIIPRTGTCSYGSTKCFGNSEAASKARKVISFVLKNSVSNFDEKAFKTLVKQSLRDTTSVVLIRYLCPSSNCPGGRCNDPFATVSGCLTNYNLATNRVSILQSQEDDDGSVVAFEIKGSDIGIVESYTNKQLPGVVSMSDRWEPEHSSEIKKSEDDDSPVGIIIGIVLGIFGCVSLTGVAIFLRKRKTNSLHQTPSFTSPMSELDDEIMFSDDGPNGETI